MNQYASFDLHAHSIWSYDACTPVEYYFQRAQELNLRAFAITDHHNSDAWDEIRQVATKYPGVGFIHGAEMTAKHPLWCGDLVCLGLPDTPTPKLQKIFDAYHQLQRTWGDELCRLLQEAGKSYTREERKKLLLTYRPQKTLDLQGITHVRNEIQRDYLIAKHVVKDAQELATFLGKASNPEGTYDSFRLLEATEIIDAVHEAGGIVIIAHPTYYFNGRDERRMDQLTEAMNLDGIECAHPIVPPENTDFYRKYCLKHKLLSSAGTDVHQDPPHEYLKLSPGRDFARHLGQDRWLDEILERVTLCNA